MRTLTWFAVLLATVCAVAFWFARGRAVALPEAPQLLPCASYAPFHRPGQTPFDRNLVISREQIDDDLARIATRFRCVRTYSVSQGLAEVPHLAREHGLRVLLGIWIGRTPADNLIEIKRAIAVAKQDADLIDGIIVGNEVLLRREQTPAILRDYLQRVRRATRLPVTYADVWEFWIRNAELADAVDFVTVHILPYWEDDPVPEARAVAHVLDVYAHVREVFAGKRVVIGETGWPSAGRQREGAVPSLVNQAAFARTFAREADQQAIPYNLVEAIDQPWKRRLEGTVGGAWGFFNAEMQEKYPLAGPVREDAEWRMGLYAAAAGAALLALLAVSWQPAVRVVGLAFAVLAGAGVGAAAWGAYVEFLAQADTWGERVFGWVFLGLSLAAAIGLIRSLAEHVAHRPGPHGPAPAASLIPWFCTNESAYSARGRRLGALRVALLFGVTVGSVLLVTDPRYRGFPVLLYAAPVLGFLLLALLRRAAVDASGFEERALAVLLLACLPVILVREGLANTQALAWVALGLSFSASVLLSWRYGKPAPGEAAHADDEADRSRRRTV